MEGLEWFFYNNAPAYHRMKDILGLQTHTSSPTESDSPDQEKVIEMTKMLPTVDPENQSPNPAEFSLMERLLPLQFECTTGAVMIGNTELKSMLVMKTAQASGIYSIAKPRSKMDFYKSEVDVVLRRTQINLKDNMDYTSAEVPEERILQPLPKTTLLAYFIRPFRCLFPFSKTRQYGEMQHMSEMMKEGVMSNGSANEHVTYHEEYARVNSVLECNEMALTYYADYAGPVPTPETSDEFAGVGIDIGNGGLPPEWGIKILLWDATIHYGPWTDRQRTAMQDYFFPNSHRGNIPTTRLMPGQQRVATSFDTYIEFMNEGKLRVPTREKSKDWKFTPGSNELEISSDGYYSRPFGWLDIKAGEGSSIKVVTPFATGEDGYINIIDINLRDTDISTSVNYASFIQSNKIDIQCTMPAPLQWNGFREWGFKINTKRPRIFLLRDHIYLLQDLVKDWISGPPGDLLHFTPMLYQIEFHLENPTIYLCVNEHNVINNPNSIDDNAFLKLQAHKITSHVILPFTEFQPETTAIKFDIGVEQGSVGLSVQSSHTLNSFLREDDAQAALAVSLTVDGSYDYYSTVDVLRHTESCNLHVKINGATVKLFGSLIRYLFLLKDNYFGAWNNFSTIDEYRKNKQNYQEWLEQKKKQADSKPICDPFEVFLLLELEDGVLLLPENLYDYSRYSQIELRELQVELRNLDVYLDLYVNISPITISRDSNPSTQLKQTFFRTKNARDPKNYVYIDGLNIYAHRLYGPLPECATYLCHWEFDIGKITGEVKPSFLLGLSCFGQTFAYNLIDEDNAVPQEMESKDLPDVTFVKLYVQEVDVCLTSMSSSTNISMQSGILLEFDNLINEKYSQRISLKIPSILTRFLANPDQSKTIDLIDNTEYPWVEVAKADLGLNITIFRHTAEWKKQRGDQQNFIKTQDYSTRRCARLYEPDDNMSHSSQSTTHSTNDHHVGVLYAPPFRVFMYGKVDDKSALCDNVSVYSEDQESRGRYRGYSNSSMHTSSMSDIIYSVSDVDDDDDDDDAAVDQYNNELMFDTSSIQSGRSGDNDSFYTAKGSDDNSFDYPASVFYSDNSESEFESDEYDSSTEETHSQTSSCKPTQKDLKAAIPQSIPYSDYLRRFKINKPSTGCSHSNFFHSYIPPPRCTFIPEKGMEETRRPVYDTPPGDNADGYFDKNAGLKQTPDCDTTDAYGKGDEVIATTVIEATRPVSVLVTPILVKIVQELAEEIIKDDWDLESMLDALQMEYIEQLTRYLTAQYICTRFAVILPQTYLHFIQNVTVPDGLPSYKYGESFVKTQFNSEDTVLCSADIFLNDFRMTGSVRFEDFAFNEKKKKVAESNMVLLESRVHIDVGNMGSTVEYISKQHQTQSIAFGIPYETLRNKHLYTNNLNSDDTLVHELVMLDLSLDGFSFKWLGARTPNYAEMTIQKLDTIVITESVEILVGAVYSWLVFVDDLKGILENFQDQRSRQVQTFINAIADFSDSSDVVGDPIFFAAPPNMLRLGSEHFRNDVGWKLLARMRHCLRCMPIEKREHLQNRLTSGDAVQYVDSDAMFENVIETFQKWRSWEINEDELQTCRLFTLPFERKSGDETISKNINDELVKFLTSSSNFAKLKLLDFNFCIYEEELDIKENSILIKPAEFLLECLFKPSAISTMQEGRPRQSTDDIRRSGIAVADGYLDIITKLSIGDIEVSVNPYILAFARHMITVQRVFTTKLKSLSHATKSRNIGSNPSSPSPASVNNQEFDFDMLLTKVDVVAQALVNLDRIQVTAHTQKLQMESIISGVQGSALFSNPKLAPLQLFHTDKTDSDTGSGKRSSNRTSRRNGYPDPRLVLEAAGGIHEVSVRFQEALNHSNGYHYNTLLAIALEQANLNANISQITRPSKKGNRGDTCKDVLNIFSNVHKFHVHAPQSLLRLHSFVEEWQTEQGRRYHFMFQNLLKEWEEQKKEMTMTTVTASNTKFIKKLDIKLQFLLNEFFIKADLLPSLSIKYEILDFFVMVNETQHKAMPMHMYSFQLSKQVIQLITKNTKTHSKGHFEESTSTFSIPGIHSTGSLRQESVNQVEQLKLRSMISVDLISMSLDVSLIDSLLTAQSLLGNEINELVEVVAYSKQSKDTIVSDPISPDIMGTQSRIFKYAVDIALDGLSISASSPSATGVFRSNVLEAHISSEGDGKDDQLTWKLLAKNFSLSLDHNIPEENIEKQSSREDDSVYRRNCLAYILMDFSVQNYLVLCTEKGCQKATHAHIEESGLDCIAIEFIKVQTVMQPIALGKLAEMYIYYDTELGKKKKMKKDEIDQLSNNTKRIVQSIKSDLPKNLQEESHMLLEGKTISLKMGRLGIAIPLDTQSDATLPETSIDTGALLLSIPSVEFRTKGIEKGALHLDHIAIQFVKKFDQNNPDHFVAENHPRMNQISIPFVSCNVLALKSKPLQYVKADAQVGGFEIDVDGTIADYINMLSIIYVKSMNRVDAFTAKSNFLKASPVKTPTAVPELPTSSEAVHLDIECKFECQTGTIRMYPKRHSDNAHKKKRIRTLRIRTGSDQMMVEGNMSTVNIPGLSAWLIYQTPLGAGATVQDSPKRFHADILIRESKNTLHPALVQFLREVVTGLKLGIQQSSERKADRDAQVEMETNLNASLFLRLSRTQLDLSCQPSSKVICSLGWEESEFLMNAFSSDTTSRTMSCVGSVREITGVVKHHFSPEACLNARVDRILFNAMLTSQRQGGDSKDDISIIIELPNVQGDLNIRHLQDLIILNSYWFDQPILPEAPTQGSSASPPPQENSLVETKNLAASDVDIQLDRQLEESQPPAPFSKHIAVSLQTLRLSLDLGPAIGKITLIPQNFSVKAHDVPSESKGVCISLDNSSLVSEGRLSGNADFKRLLIQGRVDYSNLDGPMEREKSTLSVRSNGFTATFEYEYQNILDIVQQSLELNVNVNRVMERCDISISADLEALIARLSVKTVPVIITMVQKFNDLLQKKKDEAGLRQFGLEGSRCPTPHLSPVASAHNLNDLNKSTLFQSEVSICVQSIEIVIYPNQFQDLDNVDLQASQFKVNLQELPESSEGIHRRLIIHLSHAALAKNVCGKDLMERYSIPGIQASETAAATKGNKNLGGTKIFGIPSTGITMESTQLGHKIMHEFNAEFGGRVGVSLNIGLIKYLQEMMNMFNTQLDRALKKTTDETHFMMEPSTPLSGVSSALDMDNNNQHLDSPYYRKSLSPIIQTPSSETVSFIEEESIKSGLNPSSSTQEQYEYHSLHHVNFQPQLQIMGDATPPVEWLGLKRERIPGLVHENITLYLDKLVKIVWRAS
ncbi:hypothetical protein K501DRAFT_284510 [Backusella circina FSU 941]|nr:hypothetical protein K501DRAFT_284510 [Backusella circina FSU 941]